MRCPCASSCSTHASNCAVASVFRLVPCEHCSRGMPFDGVWTRGRDEIAIRPMTTKKTPHEVHLEHQLACLRHVHEFGAMRMQTIAYAMFPDKTPSAAYAAAKLAVRHAGGKEYLVYGIQPNSNRYYALTLRGARKLHSLDDSCDVRSTTSALSFQRLEHREWCNIVALSSRHRGLRSYSEMQIRGSTNRELKEVFKHRPDALTYYVDSDGEAYAAWHEVDLSRRSTSDKKRLAHLVHTLIKQRYLTHEEKKHDIHLVMHCGTAKIMRENRALIGAVLARYSDDVLSGPNAYSITLGEGKDACVFQVDINELPATIEGVWGSELPWPEAPAAVATKNICSE